jgi:hypothetical protein
VSESRSENLENRGAKLGNLAGGTVRDMALRVRRVTFLSRFRFSRQNGGGLKSLRGLKLAGAGCVAVICVATSIGDRNGERCRPSWGLGTLADF